MAPYRRPRRRPQQRARLTPALVALWTMTAGLAAQNCAATSTGLVPLDTPGAGPYQGHPLGLWPSGNQPPAAHRAQGLLAAAAVTPRDAAGAPDPAGRVVLLSIGMSNTTQEFSTWQPISAADPARSASVTLVDGAQGGQHAAIAADPTSPYWTTVAQRLSQAGVSAQQVQVVWLKEAVAGPTGGFPQHALQLRDYLGQIARNLRAMFPNCAMCFVSSRIYAGYATSTLNPEPYAYESGFAVRWVVEQQANGDPQLNADPLAGPVTAPWLGWGPYTWADGTTPRATDGLLWDCQDYQPDGTHPSPLGRAKVAAMLDTFFTTSEFTTPWYVGAGAGLASFSTFGQGCPGAAGEPQIAADGLPVLGNANFRIGVRRAAPSRTALLVMGTGPAALPVVGPCTLWVDPLQTLPGFLVGTDAAGRAIVPLPVPADPVLLGLAVHLQWGIDDPLGTPWPPLPGLAATAAGLAVLGL